MKKKILSIMLTFSMLAMFMPCIASAETYGDFEYERNGSGITITAYNNKNSDIEIPAEIDGLPVTSIGNFAFRWGNNGVTNLIIPDSVTSIGNETFNGCDDLKTVNIPDSVTSIGKMAFQGCGLESITIPGSVKEIDNDAFRACDSLETVTILDGVTDIGDSMFCNCESLKNVTIPDSVTSIGDAAFFNCRSLENITIHNSVTSIGKAVFTQTGLKSITIPNSVTSIDRQEYVPSFPVDTIINYEGTEEQWRQVYPYDDNFITVLCNGVPLTQETPEPTPAPTVAPAQPTAAPTETPAPEPTTIPAVKTEDPTVVLHIFTDVPETHWAHDGIMRITALGGFNGYEDGTFKPDNQITHEEFLTVVMSLTYRGDINTAPERLNSVNWADWAKPALNAAVDAGIIMAEDTDLLAVNTPITRAEMAEIISRVLDYLYKTKASYLDTGKITDWNTIPVKYRRYIAEVYAKGIISGYDDGSFGPARSLTRAEASAVIVRMIDAN